MFKKICYGLGIALVVWFVVSFIDVNMHNLDSMSYLPFNLFALIF